MSLSLCSQICSGMGDDATGAQVEGSRGVPVSFTECPLHTPRCTTPPCNRFLSLTSRCLQFFLCSPCPSFHRTCHRTSLSLAGRMTFAVELVIRTVIPNVIPLAVAGFAMRWLGPRGKSFGRYRSIYRLICSPICTMEMRLAVEHSGWTMLLFRRRVTAIVLASIRLLSNGTGLLFLLGNLLVHVLSFLRSTKVCSTIVLVVGIVVAICNSSTVAVLAGISRLSPRFHHSLSSLGRSGPPGFKSWVAFPTVDAQIFRARHALEFIVLGTPWVCVAPGVASVHRIFWLKYNTFAIYALCSWLDSWTLPALYETPGRVETKCEWSLELTF
jgi:hypothetical protein